MIYDCLLFFNELDLLELRFEELGRIVDRFVVVEAPVTFSGNPKRLFFSENRSRFRCWEEQTIHIVVDDMPSGSDPWSRERHQRNAITRGLSAARQDDTIILSDADEIPNLEAIRRWSASMGSCQFEQMFCYYWLNCVGGTWMGSRIAQRCSLGPYPDLEAFRRLECPVLEHGGWHFGYMGGAEAIVAKLSAFSHQELNCAKFRDSRYLDEVTSVGIDLFCRPNMHFKFCQVDDRFPHTVRAQREKYAPYIREAFFHEDWYPNDQLVEVCELAASVQSRPGSLLEIGCWEGKSTVALAQACFPQKLLAIDTWAGNRDENPDHETVHLARERNVYEQFLTNTQLLTKGNVVPHRGDCHEFLSRWKMPIKFAHIDASHDYVSVKRTIQAILPWLVPGGILCGDDYLTAAATRLDLQGGVERAINETLPGFTHHHNLWIWKKPNRA